MYIKEYSMNHTPFEKLKASSKHWLLGKAESNPSFYEVIESMRIAEKFHNGKRKGGEHEFSHQLNIFSYLRSLVSHYDSDKQIKILCTALLHDAVEDYPECLELLREKVSSDVVDLAIRMSKVTPDGKMSNEKYYAMLEADPLSAMVKGVDRIHNLSTAMVFDNERLLRYIKETEEFVIPLMSRCRKEYYTMGNEFELLHQTLSILIQIYRKDYDE